MCEINQKLKPAPTTLPRRGINWSSFFLVKFAPASSAVLRAVVIARALAPNPIVVLADEPTANLDTVNSAQAMDIMKKLNEETGTAFVFATHDLQVMSYANRVIKMLDGRLVNNSHATS